MISVCPTLILAVGSNVISIIYVFQGLPSTITDDYCLGPYFHRELQDGGF